MRLQRGRPVAGVDPELARNIARACHNHWSSTAAIAEQARARRGRGRDGRNLSTLFATIAWPEMELLQMLRNRSGHINVHTEDITRFTDDWRVVYRPATGTSAAQ